MASVFGMQAQGVKRGTGGCAEDERFIPTGERFIIECVLGKPTGMMGLQIPTADRASISGSWDLRG